MRDALAQLVPLRRDRAVGGRQINLDAAHRGADGAHVEAARGRSDVADQVLDEPGTIASFERQFLVVDDYRIHVRD